MLVLTTAVIVGSYTVNLKVSAERTAVDRLRRQLVADTRNLRDLQAELRTRARLPQMQRWNDDVLQMSAPVAGQYLRNPVQLAGFAAPEAAPEAAVVPVMRAVTPPAPVPVPSLSAPVVRAAYRAAPAVAAPSPARMVSAAYRPAATPPPAPPVLTIESVPLSPPPQDLLLDGQQ
jgi:hypothetical protein